MRFNQTPLLSALVPSWRSRFLLLVLLLAFMALLGRAFYLQSIRHEFLQQKGESRYARFIELSATRGRITDRQGDVLAVSTPVKSIWASPEDVDFRHANLLELCHLLGMSSDELKQKLNTSSDFIFLRRQIPPDVAQKIAALKVPGIHQQDEYRRYYPGGEVTAHVVGFTGIDEHGQEGVELSFDEMLKGSPGSRRVIKDRRGHIIEDVESIKLPREGENLALSIDAKIQYLAHSYLKQTVIANKAKAGGVVVLDVQTGEILALANWPAYNPNNRQKFSPDLLRNRVLTDVFEPGSTLKPFTVALALEKGYYRADSRIQTAPGYITIGNATIHDAHVHGELSLAEVVQKSSNVGMVKIAADIPAKEMWEIFSTLGFGDKPELGFPGAASGRLRPYKNWRMIEQATMSYGHGISVSLMQLAKAYLVFARQGDVIPLSLTPVKEAVKSRAVFSSRTVMQMREMLEMVVQPGGTAIQAQVPGYRVAGKTGTAHKLEQGRYANRYLSSFVGFAPATHPRFVVAVMIDEPSAGQYYGGAVAAPVFSQVMSGTLRAFAVPPDQPDAAIKLTQKAAKEGAI